MTDEELMKFKSLSMQDGKLNLKWFADYVAQAEREACAKLCEEERINATHYSATTQSNWLAIKIRSK